QPTGCGHATTSSRVPAQPGAHGPARGRSSTRCRSPTFWRGRTGGGRVRASDKPEIRERVWALLTARRVARFPLPLAERIPNDAGAERAAERLAEAPEWKAATRLKCNPDAPQRPVRLRALS